MYQGFIAIGATRLSSGRNYTRANSRANDSISESETAIACLTESPDEGYNVSAIEAQRQFRHRQNLSKLDAEIGWQFLRATLLQVYPSKLSEDRPTRHVGE